MKVDVWHYTICPWCRIGVHNYLALEGRIGPAVEVVFLPFLLDPGAPEAGADLGSA